MAHNMITVTAEPLQIIEIDISCVVYTKQLAMPLPVDVVHSEPSYECHCMACTIDNGPPKSNMQMQQAVQG